MYNGLHRGPDTGSVPLHATLSHKFASCFIIVCANIEFDVLCSSLKSHAILFMMNKSNPYWLLLKLHDAIKTTK